MGRGVIVIVDWGSDSPSAARTSRGYALHAAASVKSLASDGKTLHVSVSGPGVVGMCHAAFPCQAVCCFYVFYSDCFIGTHSLDAIPTQPGQC